MHRDSSFELDQRGFPDSVADEVLQPWTLDAGNDFVSDLPRQGRA
jgi:hypothetical protein